jgi:hypothetical protein
MASIAGQQENTVGNRRIWYRPCREQKNEVVSVAGCPEIRKPMVSIAGQAEKKIRIMVCLLEAQYREQNCLYRLEASREQRTDGICCNKETGRRYNLQ